MGRATFRPALFTCRCTRFYRADAIRQDAIGGGISEFEEVMRAITRVIQPA